VVEMVTGTKFWMIKVPVEHPISIALSFELAFYSLFGTQLARIKCLQKPLLDHNLVRASDRDQRSTNKSTHALERELDMASLEAKEVEEACKALVVGVPESLAALLDDLDRIQLWKAAEGGEYLHRILTMRERVVLGAC
jgi:hypothetical protein